jgi:hypothetical protein
MTGLILFAGIVIGIALTIIGGLVVIRWPEAKREREPVSCSAISSGRVRTTGPASTFDFLR